jgi:hypothetical protein
MVPCARCALTAVAAQDLGMRASDGNGRIDYEGSTARFGRGLPEKEARRIIKTIKDRYKITDDKDEALPVERL